MEKSDYLEALDDESGKFVAAIAAAPLNTPVAVCPGWTVRDLAAHQGAVWSTGATNVAAATSDHTPPADATAPESDTDLMEWLASHRARLLATLDAADSDATAWTFAADDQTAGFWLRRMLHETTMHRWDAQSVMGNIDPFYPERASDGIDEYTQVSLRYSSSKPNRDYPPESLHLHCTDTEGEWTLVGDGNSVSVTRKHSKGDAAIRGTAQELLLWVWNRPADDLEIFGDESVAAAWQNLAP